MKLGKILVLPNSPLKFSSAKILHYTIRMYIIITNVQTGEYISGWNTKVTPLGYKLMALNAAMNGLSGLQQAAV